MLSIYQGSCHCGYVRFELNAKVDHVRICNCSICAKRGTLNFRVPTEALNILTPLDHLIKYQWGSKTAEDYICPQCGILAFRKPALPTAKERAKGVLPFTGWAINVRCIEGLDYSQLPVIFIDGASL